MKLLQEHFSFCGPIFWSAQKAVPKRLDDKENIGLISMRSTGKRKISEAFLSPSHYPTAKPLEFCTNICFILYHLK